MKNFIYVTLLLVLMGCTPKVQSIEYGVDHCEFCSMSIVDAKHASQVVTSKGKNFKFDAIECMIQYMGKPESQNTKFDFILVADYLKPGELIPAQKAHYIVSKNIPSPMGAFLSATKTETDALKLIDEFSGVIFTFDQIDFTKTEAK